MDHGQRLMGERPHPWRSVQGTDVERDAADRGSRHREVSRVRADARHRSGHGEAHCSAFGEATFDIIEASPDRLKEVSGIGPMRASRITAGWAEQKAVREIMIFLHAHSVGTARAVRIFKTYGHEAVQVMTQDPYRLAREVRGIGFRTADAIASKLGMEKTAPQRLRAGVSFALQTAMDEGHCGLPIEQLTGLAERLLEVDAELIRSAIHYEIAGGEIIADTVGDENCVFLKGLHLAERTIAERLIERASGEPPWGQIDLDKALPWVDSRTGKTLSPSQTRGPWPCAPVQGVDHYGRAGGWKDQQPRRTPSHCDGKGPEGGTRRTDRARRQAHERANRP